MVPNLKILAWPFYPGSSTATEALPLLMASPGLSKCQASAALHDPPMLSKPVPSEWLLHYQAWLSGQDTTLASSGIQLMCADPEETFPGRLHLSNAGISLITTDFLALPIQHQFPSNTEVSLWKQASKQHPSVVSVLYPSSRVLVDHDWLFSPS